ncbi:MAG TPA: N-acetylmuramoyl-L-alanine amidase [Xanthobacteraceae bacterium]|nr:N-acetylmuramoyl-L-alanine amidase [Xanthobacteraceae bacterium]
MTRPAFPPDSSVVAEVVASPNHNARQAGRRPDMIILHYTGMQDADAALERLCARGSEVSSHYLVFEDGRITQMVPESRRAWHAGKSFWAGDTDINGCSIGIEIVNPGHDFGYPDFPKRQIAAVTALCRSILTRISITPVRVLAHSDVAPSRKQDPGEKFPWRTLYDSGVGHWVKPAPIMSFGQSLSPGSRGDAVAALQKSLGDYGYGIEASGEYDAATREVVIAFQRHFRPERVDGVADASTRSTLQDLLGSRGRVRTISTGAYRGGGRSLTARG